jgi:hypothetical protein
MLPDLPPLTLRDIGQGWLADPRFWLGAATMMSIAIVTAFIPRKRKRS